MHNQLVQLVGRSFGWVHLLLTKEEAGVKTRADSDQPLTDIESCRRRGSLAIRQFPREGWGARFISVLLAKYASSHRMSVLYPK